MSLFLPSRFDRNRRMHRVGSWSDLSMYRKKYAWVGRKAKRFGKPIRYRHPSGAVIWVRLDGRIVR